jgi:hypothetical protein
MFVICSRGLRLGVATSCVSVHGTYIALEPSLDGEEPTAFKAVVLSSKNWIRTISRKGAKLAKFGEIKVRVAKKKWLGGEGPWRAWRPFDVAQDMLGGKRVPKKCLAQRRKGRQVRFGGRMSPKIVG